VATAFEPSKIELSNKIGISLLSKGAKAISKNELFYSKYSFFALKSLKRYRYQEFLSLMLELEGIDKDNIDSIKVSVYPVRKKAGRGIAGKCNPASGRIYIYPKPRKFCNNVREKYGKKLLLAYVSNRARASLIHELLHVKYFSDEEKVRALTKIYYSLYMRSDRITRTSVYNLIFGCCQRQRPLKISSFSQNPMG
jgi:hypothetical protein